MKTREAANGEMVSPTETHRWSGAGVLAVAAAAAIGALLGAGPLQARSSALPSGNLVQNPGAEADVAANNASKIVTPTGWSTTGSFTSVQYDTPDFHLNGVSATIGGGKNFFAGGPNAALSTATQTIDVSGATTEIDAGGVQAKLSAFLGGYASQPDLPTMDAVFLDATGIQLGTARLGPVTAADRQSKTTLLSRSGAAAVPKGTRTIKVVLTATRGDGSYDDGYFDNISLELVASPPPPPPPPPPAALKPTLAVACSGKTLVATVRPGSLAGIKSVAFLVNGIGVSIDKKAPFKARISTAGLPKRLKVTARVFAAGKTIVLTKAVGRC